MRIESDNELMYPQSALPDIKRRAVKEYAERLRKRLLTHCAKFGAANKVSVDLCIDNTYDELYGADE